MATFVQDVSLPGQLKSTALTRLSNVGSANSDDHKAAEDGRRRTQTLPPISKEKTVLQSKSTTSSQHSREYTSHGLDYEVGGSHWHLKQRHLQAKTDEKIINHLKKKLNKRILKRLNAYFWADKGDAEAAKDETPHESKERNRQRKSRERRRSRRVDIFSQYSDYGDKVLGPRSTSEGNIPVRRLLDPLPLRSRSISPRKQDDPLRGMPADSMHSAIGVPFQSANTLPEINAHAAVRKESACSSKANSILKSGQASRRSSGQRVTLPQPEPPSVKEIESIEQSSNIDSGDEENSTVDQEIQYTLSEETDDDNFKKMVVSPVPTPHVFRPETRDSGRLENKDKITKILQGNVNIHCLPDVKTLRIYVSSATTDSQAESAYLIQHAYPVLKQYSLERGCELQIVDLHWGMHGSLDDSHCFPELCQQLLETCQQSSGVNFISFLGQKYGSSYLPRSMGVQEFNDIVEAMTEDWDQLLREMSINEMKRIEARETASKAKDSAQKEDGENAAKTDKTNKADESPQITENGEAKNEPGTSETSLALSTGNADVFQVPDWADEGKIALFMQNLKADRNQFHALAKRLKNDLIFDPSTLTDWYKLDENMAPPMYILQPISAILKDVNQKDSAKRQQARATWLDLSEKMLQAIQTYSTKLYGEEHTRKYFTSLTHLEHEQGLIEADSPETQCLWFKREISDIMKHIGDSAATHYLDLVPGKATVVPRLEVAHRQLVEAVTQRLLPTQIKRSLVTWGKDGIDPASNRAHRIYLERMCEEFVGAVKENIDAIAHKRHEMIDNFESFHELADEVRAHVHFCHERAREFQGRKNLMNLIKSYVLSSCRQPLVLHGQSGSGKTSLVCRAAKDIHKWFTGNVAVIVRSVGVTTQSTNIRLLLKDILLQLCYTYGKATDEVPDDYKGIVNDFDNRICYATKEKPLVIVIDSLDQLSDENDGRKLSWLPRELPPNVHVILSTLPGEQYGTMNALKRLYEENNNNAFVEVPTLPAHDAEVILDHWLSKSRRTLTRDQHEVLLKAFETCATPLYLKVIFYESLRWNSNLQSNDIKLSNTVGKIATVLFGRLEKDYGDILVRRTLGYITASRNGLTSSEMEDLLSLDDPTMAEISASHASLTVRRCPPVVWLRLKSALEKYLTERSADGVTTLKWFHIQFHEAAVQRYLNQRDKAPSYHKAMAEYFTGKWANGRVKPFHGNEVGLDRCVAQQPLFFKVLDDGDSTVRRVYNQRKLSELPWHFLKSPQFADLKAECLCNFEWVLAKLCATSLRVLLDDYQLALAVEPKDKDLLLLTETLQLSRKVLEVNPQQLASQMVGRLHTIITKDVPVAPQDPLVYPALHPFFKQAKSGGSFPSLVPSMTCLAEPGGILFDVLSGHSDAITAVAVTSDSMQAVTAAKDDTMKLWNLATGKVVKTIKSVGADVVMLRVACNNRLVISSERTRIRVWNVNSGECVSEHKDFVDPAVLTIAGGGTILVSFFDGANTMRSWDLNDNMTLLQEVVLEEKSIHKDRSIMVSQGTRGDNVLHGYRSANHATVRNCKTGKVVFNLKCDERSSSIRALGTTGEYYIVASKVPFMQLNEIYALELFDIQKGKYLRTVRGCQHDHVTDLYINNLGSHAMCVVANESTNTSNIAIWNLETEDHKHLAHHVDVSVIAACGDFRYCLTGSQNDNTLRVWNLSGMINKPASKLRHTVGVSDIYPMKDNPRYAIGKTLDNSTLSVWNVINSKCKGSAVRIEHGLVGPTDIVLIYNAKVYILTDRALSTISDDNTQQVFQTVHVYDLKTKRYLNRVSSYIVPSPPHEYVLLDEDTLMGLNDSRGHFVMWNMSTGRVVDRMKAVHPDQNIKYDNNILEQAKERARNRHSTAKMTPWERRAETLSAQNRRREMEIAEEKRLLESVKKERDNSIDQFVISADQSTLVASYYAHHLCVFDVLKRSHVHTLENPNSMLFLHVSAITADGAYLAHTNYDDSMKTSYVTVWDCQKGVLRKRLKNEKDVCAVALTDDGCRIVFAKTNNELKVWHPFESTSLRKLKGYRGMNYNIRTKLYLMDEGKKVVVFSGDVSLWDIEKGEVLAVFTPDMNIECCNLVMDGNLIAIGLRDSTSVITLKYKTREISDDDTQMGHDMFGEAETSSEEEDEDEEN